jgi:hypothetical protein
MIQMQSQMNLVVTYTISSQSISIIFSRIYLVVPSYLRGIASGLCINICYIIINVTFIDVSGNVFLLYRVICIVSIKHIFFIYEGH